MGVFPALGAGSASVSTLVSEEELLNDNVAKAEKLGITITDKKQFMRSFILQVGFCFFHFFFWISIDFFIFFFLGKHNRFCC